MFDERVLGVDSTERLHRPFLIHKHDLLRVTNGRKKTTDRVLWNFAREEEPVDGAIERELSRRTREDQQHQIRIAPDSAHD